MLLFKLYNYLVVHIKLDTTMCDPKAKLIIFQFLTWHLMLCLKYMWSKLNLNVLFLLCMKFVTGQVLWERNYLLSKDFQEAVKENGI